ncbi:MAG: HD domain-containing protein [Clostridium butyricum]|nr:HD domain-containing protein [Clostridium butyricum]
MYLDRIKAKRVFNDYVENYDSSNEKIKLKIDHTYRVSELCERIALSIGMSKEDIDIAWLTGLLHDIGRFEQVRRYGTFNDFRSIDHAKLGVEILFNEGNIRDFVEDTSKDELIKNVIECHNAYKIPENFSKRTTVFSNILRDADKIDIFKVNIIVPIEEIYNVKREEIYTSVVTQEVLDNLKRKDTVLRKLKKTAVDNIVGHISLIFGLVYDESIKITVEQGYLEKLMEFKSKNQIINKQFEEIRSFVHAYIKERLN